VGIIFTLKINFCEDKLSFNISEIIFTLEVDFHENVLNLKI